jgi:MarR family transcriptional regulator for hemolysin
MSDLQERFSLALHNSARSWRLALDRRLKHLGVSQASWLTIAVVARASSDLSQSELADKLGVEGATMVAMIDRLVKAGLVIRVPSSTDRRVKKVALTEDGKRLYESLKAEADTFRRELLANAAPERLRAATELLEHLQSMLDRPEFDRPP